MRFERREDFIAYYVVQCSAKHRPEEIFQGETYLADGIIAANDMETAGVAPWKIQAVNCVHKMIPMNTWGDKICVNCTAIETRKKEDFPGDGELQHMKDQKEN